MENIVKIVCFPSIDTDRTLFQKSIEMWSDWTRTMTFDFVRSMLNVNDLIVLLSKKMLDHLWTIDSNVDSPFSLHSSTMKKKTSTNISLPISDRIPEISFFVVEGAFSRYSLDWIEQFHRFEIEQLPAENKVCFLHSSSKVVCLSLFLFINQSNYHLRLFFFLRHFNRSKEEKTCVIYLYVKVETLRFFFSSWWKQISPIEFEREIVSSLEENQIGQISMFGWGKFDE